MAGLHFEQFEIGRIFEHEIRRTVTESDNVWFCAATYNPARIHIDAEYCAATEFKQPLVNSIFTRAARLACVRSTAAPAPTP